MKRILSGAITVMTLFASISAYAHSFSSCQGGCFDWSGFYGGVSVGNAWDRVGNTLQVINNPVDPFFAATAIPGVNSSGSPNINGSHIFEGIQGGYNYQSLDAVYGIEVALNNFNSTVNRNGTFFLSNNGLPYTLNNSATTKWLFSLRPRYGWATHCGALWYFTAGLAVAKFEYSQSFSQAPAITPTAESISFSRTRAGWTVGAGVEYAFFKYWSIKGEYLYNRFNSQKINGRLTAPSGSATFNNYLTNHDVHMVDIGINYYFM